MSASPYPTGYTKELPEEVKLTNELHAVIVLLFDNPTNVYWLKRLDAVLKKKAGLGLERPNADELDEQFRIISKNITLEAREAYFAELTAAIAPTKKG